MLIYGLQDPLTQELRYIGFTSKDIDHRLQEHLSPCYLKFNTHKNKWIKSLLKNGFKPDIFEIQSTDINHWKEDEKYNISYFRYIGCRLTNATEGGEGNSNPSLEVRKKISKTLFGRKLSKNTRNKISKSKMGNKNHLYGKERSNETKNKIRDTLRKHFKNKSDPSLALGASYLRHYPGQANIDL